MDFKENELSGLTPSQVVMVNNSGHLVNSGYSGDRDWGQWDPNWGGKGFLPPAPEYEVAIVAVPAVVFGGTAAIVTAPQWVPPALMLGGSVGSMVNTRIAQFFANNSWALPTLNKLNWIADDLWGSPAPGKIEIGLKTLKWLNEFTGDSRYDPNVDYSKGRADYGRNGVNNVEGAANGGSAASGGSAESSQARDSLAVESTPPVGGAGGASKP